MFLEKPRGMMTYSKGAMMQVEVSSLAILVFNEISSGGVSACQVSNHLKGSLLFSLSIGKKKGTSSLFSIALAHYGGQGDVSI